LPTGFTPFLGEQFQLIDGQITGTFNSVTVPSLPNGETWDTSDLYTTGTITVVPEPASITLMFASGCFLLRCRK
jgi:hypothetical protein